jgi:hypothetical protein
MFDTITLSYGSYSRRIGGNTPQPAYTNGGVLISILDETFKEDASDVRIDTLETNPYEDITGSFTIKIVGATSSGVMYFAREIATILRQSALSWKTFDGLPVRLSFGNSDQVVLKSANVTFKDVILAESTKYLTMDVEYTRLPIVGTMVDPDLSVTTAFNSTIDTPYVLTNAAGTFRSSIPAPTSLQVKIYDMAMMFPSGILLTSNQPIVSISGSLFYNGTVANNPPSLNVINENGTFPYSQSSSATTGLLRYVPTTTNPILSSGIIYANGRTSNVVTQMYAKNADVYAVYRTTVSGTLFNVAMVANNITNGGQYVTPYTQLQHSTSPQIAYLGTLYTDDRLANSKLSLSMYPTGLISGALIIDRVIVQALDSYAARSIQISKFDLTTQDPITNPETPSTSGTFLLSLYANYNAAASDFNRFTFLPNIIANRGSVARKIPSYQGNIALFTKPQYLELGDSTLQGTTISTLFLSTGSTYDTVSGQANWTFTNRISQKALVTWQVASITNPKIIVLG